MILITLSGHLRNFGIGVDSGTFAESCRLEVSVAEKVTGKQQRVVAYAAIIINSGCLLSSRSTVFPIEASSRSR